MGGAPAVVAPYVLACVFTISCGAVAGVHTVSQASKLSIHEDGRVDVTMTMTFHIEDGAVLSRMQKSILPDASSPSLDRSSLAATDSLGQHLRVHHIIQQGWHNVDIDFSHRVNGSVFPRYRVRLKYSLLGAICSTPGSSQRINLDWAHRWGTVQVTQSRYEIEFVNSRPSMDSVCFASSSLRARCGRYNLDVNGNEAAYQVGAGVLHGAFFTWTAAAKSTSQRKCGYGQQVNIHVSTRAGSDAKMQGNEKQAFSSALIAVLIGSCVVLFLACLFCMLIRNKCTSRQQHRDMDITTPRSASKQMAECSLVTILAHKISYRKSESIGEGPNLSGSRGSPSDISTCATALSETDVESESIGGGSSVSTSHEPPSEISTCATISTCGTIPFEMDIEQGFALPQADCDSDCALSFASQSPVKSVFVAGETESISSSTRYSSGQENTGASTPEFENAFPSIPAGLLDNAWILGDDDPADHGIEVRSSRIACFEAGERTLCKNAPRIASTRCDALLDNDQIPSRSARNCDAMDDASLQSSKGAFIAPVRDALSNDRASSSFGGLHEASLSPSNRILQPQPISVPFIPSSAAFPGDSASFGCANLADGTDTCHVYL